jgi:hypothetical protein
MVFIFRVLLSLHAEVRAQPAHLILGGDRDPSFSVGSEGLDVGRHRRNPVLVDDLGVDEWHLETA